MKDKKKILNAELNKRPDFELFKSNVCHNVKRLGDLSFILDIIENDTVMSYFNNKWYLECFYLLAMIDYLSRINDVPLCTRYDSIRKLKLPKLLYPTDVYLSARYCPDDMSFERALEDAIPEFLNFNIVESDIRNVV